MEPAEYYLEKYGIEDAKNKVMKTLSKIYDADDLDDVYDYTIKQYQIKTKKSNPSFVKMFSRTYIRQTISGIMLQTMQQLSGVNFFVFYSTKIFGNVGVNGDIANIVLQASQFTGGFICMFT